MEAALKPTDKNANIGISGEKFRNYYCKEWGFLGNKIWLINDVPILWDHVVKSIKHKDLDKYKMGYKCNESEGYYIIHDEGVWSFAITQSLPRESVGNYTNPKHIVFAFWELDGVDLEIVDL